MSATDLKNEILRSRKKLGFYLLEAGLIDENTLAEALEIQKSENKRLGQVLMEMKATNDLDIAKVLSDQLKIPLIRLKGKEIPQKVISLVPAEIAQTYLLIPVELANDRLTVAMVNPQEVHAIEDLRFLTRMRVDIAVTPQGDFLEALWRYYPAVNLQKVLDSGASADDGLQFVTQSSTSDKDIEDLIASTEAAPVVRLANAILSDAFKLRASDIHIEAQRSEVHIRYRIDGVMREIMRLHKHVHAALISRIKIMSNMDISIRRKPQDGRTKVKYEDKEYDLRIATIPTSYGEQMSIRILDQSQASANLQDLGLPEKWLGVLEEAIGKPQGIILVTGPTGSGKSTTLYACLSRLNTPSVKIVTVEDPIEYDIAGVNQVAIDSKAGLTFASGLRSILRHDPDVVMVGEVRDQETASVALQAGMTGHLVFSTLHTNDSPSAVIRLMDLGLEPFVISNALLCVVGQRLVRKICPACKEPDPLTAQIFRRIHPYLDQESGQKTLWKGRGCEACQYTGYSGRIGIFELFMITPYLRELLLPKVTALRLKQAAQREGFEPMAQDGIRKALAGLTTIDEVFRVAPPEVGQISEMIVSDPVLQGQDEITEIQFADGQFSAGAIRPKKILLIDDDDVFLRVVETILVAENYQVISVLDGREGLKLAMEEKPDLIITDVKMPEMDGITLVRKLKSQLSTRIIPTIMLTVKGDLSTEVEGFEAGADDYLTKPIQPERLVARVRRFLHSTNPAGGDNYSREDVPENLVLTE